MEVDDILSDRRYVSVVRLLLDIKVDLFDSILNPAHRLSLLSVQINPQSDPYITKNILTAMLGVPVQTDGVEQPQTEEPETSNSGAGLSVRKGETDDEQD